MLSDKPNSVVQSLMFTYRYISYTVSELLYFKKPMKIFPTYFFKWKVFPFLYYVKHDNLSGL